MCFAYGKTTCQRWLRPPWNPLKSAAPMARPTLPLTVLRRHQVTLSLRDAELVELRRRASAARLPVPDYLRQRALSERLRVASPQRVGGGRVPRGVAACGEREPDRPLLASGPPASERHAGRGRAAAGIAPCSCSRRRRTECDLQTPSERGELPRRGRILPGRSA